MKRAIYILALTISLGLTPIWAQQNNETKLLDLIKTLAILADKGEACGEHMNYFGKRALEGEVCKEYAAAVFTHWPTRDELDAEIDNLLVRQSNGELNCDNCDTRLQRIHELRVTVTYFLDYMEFVKTM